MIEIDLMPEQLREKKQIPIDEIFKTRVILFILGCLILFHSFLYAVGFINAKRLNALEKSWQNLSFKRTKIDQLEDRLAEINKEIPLIERLIQDRVLWSEKLNQISDLIMPGVWLREITIERQRAQDTGESLHFIIRGSAASRARDEPALIGRFMQDLKDDRSFSADFAEIELGPIKKGQIAQTEIMDFVLNCQFKKDRTGLLQ